MKLLYFHQHFSTPAGSTGIRSYEMARKLIAAGHKVTMVCGSYGGGKTGLDNVFYKGRREGVVDGIHIIEFDLGYSNKDSFIKRTMTFLSFSFKSIGLVFKQDYDLVFATTTPLTAGIPGIFAKWFRRKPFVFEVRDLWPEIPKNMGVIKNPVVLWMMGVLEWMSYKSADRLIGLSPGIVNGIKRHNIQSQNVALVPNGCDLDIFADKSEPWRPEGVSEDDLMAVFTGTHGFANGLDAVIDAAVELQKRGNDKVKFVLVGQGALKEKLQQRARDAGLGNMVFHPPVPKKQLAGLLASADIGMQILANVPAFYYGTSPNKFFDYIAAGLPVINNYPGWLADMIGEHKCGYTVEPDNAVAFADAMEKALAERAQLPQMGKNGRALAEREFDRQLLAGQFVQWLEGSVPGDVSPTVKQG